MNKEIQVKSVTNEIDIQTDYIEEEPVKEIESPSAK
jgi:hypothetical protein